MPKKPEPRKTPAPKGSLPSADDILQFIASSPGTVGKREISRAFSIKGADKIGLKKLLKDMEADGRLSSKHRQIRASAGLPPVGVIEIAGADKDGDLFGHFIGADGVAQAAKLLVVPGDGKSPKRGDRVVAKISALPGHHEFRHQALVMRVLGGRPGKILAIFRLIKGKGARLIPVDKKARHEYQVLAGDDGGAANGELVAIEVTRERGFGLPAARVRERLGNLNDPRNISLIAINQHGIPNSFPDVVVKEAESLSGFSSAKRRDLTAVPLITIDPVDARDHDDAVFAEADDTPGNAGGFKVIVAIADVAAYVRPASALDREARFRGNSVYFPDRVVPMLPERISNDLCSLRELEVRPALACFLRFDRHGHKLEHSFARIAMRSAAKLSYEEAQAAIDGRPSAKAEALLKDVLKPLWAAYAAVKVARDKRSPLALELPERKIIMDGEGNIARVVSPERLDAHMLIEEFMIQANVAAAEELEKRNTALLYRVHESPSPEKLKALGEFLKTVNRTVSIGTGVRPTHFNRLLSSVKGEEFEALVHQVVLRSQAQATYSPENLGHFGLNLARYAHFTSPIRRYADLIVHRALISALNLGPDGLSGEDIAHLEETAELISVAERRAMIAERETTDRLIAAFLAPHVGAVFKGRISGVVGAGLFVTLDGTGADGFVPVSTLGRGYFVYDEAAHRLVAERGGEAFQLGDKVEVKLIEVAPVKGGLRFEMVSEGRQSPPPRRPKKKGRRR
ncbi:MAG: ribonuclease R [Alphaproteobacteria bacterium]|nr:ribonuclease R [Alphaproteobacteria bacterium]